MSNPIDIVESELYITDKGKFTLEELVKVGFHGDRHVPPVTLDEHIRGGGYPTWAVGISDKVRRYGPCHGHSIDSWWEDDIIAELLALVAIGVTGYIVLADQWHQLNKYVLGSEGVNVCGVKGIEWDDPHTHYDVDGNSYTREEGED